MVTDKLKKLNVQSLKDMQNKELDELILDMKSFMIYHSKLTHLI